MNDHSITFIPINTAKIAGKQAPHKGVLLPAIMDLGMPIYTEPIR
jgi:hypothetical protein